MMIWPEKSLADCVAELRGRVGSVQLDDEDIILLALDEISRTTTYIELAYGNEPPCAT